MKCAIHKCGQTTRSACSSPHRCFTGTVRSPPTWMMTLAWGEPTRWSPRSCRGKLAQPWPAVSVESPSCEGLKLFEVCRFPLLPAEILSSALLKWPFDGKLLQTSVVFLKDASKVVSVRSCIGLAPFRFLSDDLEWTQAGKKIRSHLIGQGCREPVPGSEPRCCDSPSLCWVPQEESPSEPPPHSFH